MSESKPARKLQRSMMRSWAARHLQTEQGGLCPLCSLPIDLKIKGEGCIDHDHDTGEIRGVLHRSCNASEGRVANAAGRWGAKSMAYSAIIPWLENLLRYYHQPGTGWTYPTHQSPDEKRDARLAKAREQRAALKARRELARQKRQGTE